MKTKQLEFSLTWHQNRQAEIGAKLMLSLCLSFCLALIVYPHLDICYLIIWICASIPLSLFTYYVGKHTTRQHIQNAEFFRQYEMIIWIVALIWSLFWSVLPYTFKSDTSETIYYQTLIYCVLVACFPVRATSLFYKQNILFLTTVLFNLFTCIHYRFDNYQGLLDNFILASGLFANVFLYINGRKLEDEIQKSLEHEYTKKQFLITSQDYQNLITTASNELKQPISALNYFLDCVDHQNIAKSTELLRQVHESAKNIDGLFSHILDLSVLKSKTITPENEAFDIQSVLLPLIQKYDVIAHQQQVNLSTNTQAYWLKSDPILFKKLLNNLLKYILAQADKGEVHIDLCFNQGLLDINLTCASSHLSDKEMYFLQHSDTTPEQNNQLSLDLIVSKALCTLLGIKLSAKNKKNKGSSIKLHLPASKPDQKTSINDSLISLANTPVLCITPPNESKLITLLKHWDTKPLIAHSCAQAESLFKGLQELPKIIIIDDSYINHDSLRNLYTSLNSPPVIVLGQHSLTCSSVYTVEKPIKPAFLRSMMQRLISPNY